MPTPFNGEQLRKREKARETANNIILTKWK